MLATAYKATRACTVIISHKLSLPQSTKTVKRHLSITQPNAIKSQRDSAVVSLSLSSGEILPRFKNSSVKERGLALGYIRAELLTGGSLFSVTRRGISTSMFSLFRKNRGEQEGEIVVCKESDLKNGEMKEVEVGKGKILIAKDGGQFYAVGNKCSHYAAPLVKGVVCDGHVRCPWHGACFNLKTGDIEDFPGIDSLPAYEVRVAGGEVRVKVSEKTLQPARRQKNVTRQSRKDDRTFVIVGGGPAAATCSETLRQEGFEGRIVVLTKEPVLPYDRPKLSKALNMKAEELVIRPPEHYKQCDIEYRINTEVSGVECATNSVKLANGESVKYDKLLIATGAIARECTFIKNHELKNIYTLRTVQDANTISEMGKDKNVIIIGTSFIGVEVAATLVSKAASVTIIDLVEAPFQLALGAQVGGAVKKLLESKGIKFYFKNSVKEFLGQDGVLKGAILKDDTKLDADMCVVGIGVVPATAFLKDCGLAMNERGFLPVNKQMQTSVENVYAAGDVTSFPLFMMNDESVNVQHWQMALKQGQIAALNMLKKNVDIKSVPYFWTVMFGKSLRYCGYGVGYDDIVIHGDLDNLQFVAYYTKGERVIAVASLNFDPVVSQAAELFLSNQTITKDEVKSDPTAWTARLSK